MDVGFFWSRPSADSCPWRKEMRTVQRTRERGREAGDGEGTWSGCIGRTLIHLPGRQPGRKQREKWNNQEEPWGEEEEA